MSREKRTSPRYAVRFEVAYRHDADFVREYATNLSRGGLFVATLQLLPMNSRVELQMVLPDGRTLETTATVVHLREEAEVGMGLQFSEDLAFAELLRDYLVEVSNSRPPERPPPAVTFAEPGPFVEAKPGVIFGNYEVLSFIGQGGMAQVYRARVRSGPREGWPVALKRLSPELSRKAEYIALFEREARLTALLQHPNIVEVLEAGRVDDTLFLAMELVDGRDLAQILARCAEFQLRLPADFSLFLVTTLLEALDSAHTAEDSNGAPLGLAHCDVSPSNVFISRTGHIKLGDFGLAQPQAALQNPSTVIKGKMHYLSPEALDGAIGPEADLWAATVVLYELLTGRRPFEGETPEETFQAIRKRRFRGLRKERPDLPRLLSDLVERAFSKKGFGSAREYAQALRPFFDEQIGTPLAIAAVVRGLFADWSSR